MIDDLARLTGGYGAAFGLVFESAQLVHVVKEKRRRAPWNVGKSVHALQHKQKIQIL